MGALLMAPPAPALPAPPLPPTPPFASLPMNLLWLTVRVELPLLIAPPLPPVPPKPPLPPLPPAAPLPPVPPMAWLLRNVLYSTVMVEEANGPRKLVKSLLTAPPMPWPALPPFGAVEVPLAPLPPCAELPAKVQYETVAWLPPLFSRAPLSALPWMPKAPRRVIASFPANQVWSTTRLDGPADPLSF